MSIMVFWGATVVEVVAALFLGDTGFSQGVVSMAVSVADIDLSLAGAFLAFLVPAGLTMIAVGRSSEKEAATVAVMGLIGVALGVLVYALIGFGFQFGGLGLFSNLQGSGELVSEWSPVDRVLGTGWGIIGLDGFLLLRRSLEADLLSLFLYQGALAATAVTIVLLALARRLGFLALIGLGLFHAVVVYPIYGNWVWGGGWLSQVGANLGLGHGFIDFGGSGTIQAAGGLVALAAILTFGSRLARCDEPLEPPPVHFPLLALLGSFLLLLGWFGLIVGNPLHTANVSYAQMAVNVLVAACGGILVSALYIWFATGRVDPLMVARGVVAALVAISASCAFVPLWAALVIGALAGLLLPLTIYLAETKLRLDDPTASVAMHVIPGIWGLLALGIFADGSSGQGWNGIGAREYLTIAGQGVSGLVVRSGFQPDWPQQFYAQIAGVVALLALSFGGPWLVMRGANNLAAVLAGPRSQTEGITDDSPEAR